MGKASVIATLQAISPKLATKLTHERVAFLKQAAAMQTRIDRLEAVLTSLVDSARNSDGTFSRSVRVTELHAAAKALEETDGQEEEGPGTPGRCGDPAGDETDQEPEGGDRGG